MRAEAMATKDLYERIAGLYDVLDYVSEFGRYRPIRRQIFSGISGRILDAGVGTGRNMPYYPAGGEVVGIDFSPAMPRRAAGRGAAARSSFARWTSASPTFPTIISTRWSPPSCSASSTTTGSVRRSRNSRASASRAARSGSWTTPLGRPRAALRHALYRAVGALALRRCLRPGHRTPRRRRRARTGRATIRPRRRDSAAGRQARRVIPPAPRENWHGTCGADLGRQPVGRVGPSRTYDYSLRIRFTPTPTRARMVANRI